MPEYMKNNLPGIRNPTAVINPFPSFLPCAVGIELIGLYAILFYHIWPSEFGNGSLGADVLFVVFGFQISAQVFSQSDGPNSDSQFAQFLHFLWANFVQTIPLYGLILFTTLIAGILLFVDEPAINGLYTDLAWALPLATNFQLNATDWTMELLGVPYSRPFFHLWLPSCQIQLLLALSPVLKFAHWLNESSNNKLPKHFLCFSIRPKIMEFWLMMALCVLIFVASFLFWLMSPSVPALMSWPCSRCWQFLLGCFSFMAYYRQSNGLKQFSPEGKEGIGIGILCEHCLFYAIAFVIGLLFFMPSMFFWPWLLQQKSLLAAFASLASAFLLYYYPAKLKQSIPPTQIAQTITKFLTGFPFVCYLVYQPSLVFIRYILAVSLLDVQEGLAALFAISLISLFINFVFNHLFISGHFVKIKKSRIFGFSGIFYSLCFIMLMMAPNSSTWLKYMKSSNGMPTNHLFLPQFNLSTGIMEQVEFGLASAKTFLEQLQMESYRNLLIPRLKLAHKIKLNEMMKNTFIFDPLSQFSGHAAKSFIQENGIQLDKRQANRIFQWEIEGNGTSRVLIFGNSHAQMIWREMSDIFHGNYRQFSTIAVPACMPMFLEDWRVIFGISCSQITRSLLNKLEEDRPNTLFLVAKWYSELHSVPFDAENAKKDTTLSQLQSFFDQAQRHVRDKIYIIMPNLEFPSEISHQLAKRLWQKGEKADDGGGGIGHLNKKYKAHLEETRWSRLRLEHLNCPKCVFLDLSKAFCELGPNGDGICQAFDPATQLAYFSDTNHLTYLGRLKVKEYLDRRGIIL